MNRQEENKYSMYRGVKTILQEHQNIIQAIPKLVDIKTTFEAHLETLSRENDIFLHHHEGKTREKANAEEALIRHLVAFGRPAKTYAIHQNDEPLISLFSLAKWKLERLRDTDLLELSQSVLEKLEGHQEALASYGLAADKIETLSTKVDDYRLTLDTAESSNAVSQAARRNLTDIFGKIDDVLYDELDNMMKLFEIDNPRFFRAYQEARSIYDRVGAPANSV